MQSIPLTNYHRKFVRTLSSVPVLQSVFEPSKVHKKEYFWQVQTIQKELKNHLKASDIPNLRVLGETIKKLKWPHGGIDGAKGYYLRLKS